MGSREGVREAVAQGLGLGVVSDGAFTEDHRVVTLPVEGLVPHNHVQVVCRKGRAAVQLISSFLQTVRQLGAVGGAGSATKTIAG